MNPANDAFTAEGEEYGVLCDLWGDRFHHTGSMGPRICSSSFVLTLAIFLSIYSCASLREWIIGKDNFSRTYAVDFMSFHPRLNSALQDYAKNHKGNSFRVALLGNDGVIIQGFYKGEQEQGRLPSTIAAKPAGPQKTWLEIQISSNNLGASSKDLERAAQELFLIIEKGTGIRPLDE